MNLSNRERSIFGHMVFETGITVYYLWYAMKLPVDTLLNSKEWVGLVISLIPIGIVGGIIVGAIVIGTKSKTTAADERDRGIESKADGIAYRMMIVAIALYLGLIGFTYGIQPDLVPDTFAKQWLTFAITPLSVLNALVIIMFVAETTKYACQLWFYRRGY
ncbi:MAG: hypothetical protein COA60_003005 [Robiginitomaculum sp.]|nr:hypothetical protein [Robiginitomaculum sp.]